MKNPLSLLVLIFCLSTAMAKQPASSSGRPNILLIVADDLGYSDLGCFGSDIPTQNLDKLAAEGLRFRQFYNSAKCEPTRTMIMSGQHWHDAGMKINKGPTMGHVMQSAGYRTYAVGKWHLHGNPVDVGFDRYFGHLGGATNYFRGDKSFRLDSNEYKRPKEFYATSAYGDFAIDFIEEGAKQHPDKPFFMYLAHSAPHSPLMALSEDKAKFRGKYKKGWDVANAERIEKQLKTGIIDASWPIPERPNTIPAWDELSEEEKDVEDLRMSTYAAMVYRMDISIGRVIDKLEELGLRENTLIIFMSDNGSNPFDRGRQNVKGAANKNHNYGLGWAYNSNTPYRLYKRNQHQGGACTGAIFNWPSHIKNPGTVTDQPGYILDLMATFCDIGNASYPKYFQNDTLKPLPGASLTKALKGKTVKRKEPIYFHLFDHAAIIKDDWKLVKAFSREWELYNLSEDRAETNDLSESFPAKKEELLNEWNNWNTSKLKNNGKEPVYIKPDGKPYKKE